MFRLHVSVEVVLEREVPEAHRALVLLLYKHTHTHTHIFNMLEQKCFKK